MNEIQTFNNPVFGEIRTVTINDEPWFVGKDVALVLGYKDTSDALKRHVDGEDKLTRCFTDSGQNREMFIINESGLYSLILSSKLPGAKDFKKWVTSEVLPSIRKHGAYMTPETLQAAILNPDTMIQLCQQLKAEQDKNKVLQIQNSRLTVDNQIMQPKADYFDELVERNTLTNFRETAQQLGIKQKLLVQFLLGKKYIYRDKKGKLMPEAMPEESADETEIPPKAETEEAKQELRKAVRMPIQGTNAEALLQGIKSKELSMESITLSGSVEGFNDQQRHHLVSRLLEGVYTDSEVIKIDVPYDGKFEIVNTPGNVAKVLENLKVRVNQEAMFDKRTISLLTSNGDVRIVELDGQKYLSNSYVMIPATDTGVEYIKAEFNGKEM